MRKTKKFLPQSGRYWSLLLLLATGIITRAYIFARIEPKVQTDSITYFILSDITVFRTPGYPLFIEAIQFINDIFSISSDYFGLIVFIQTFLLGMGNCYLIYRFAKKITNSELFSLGVGILYNCNYFILGFEFQILTELMATTLLLLTLLCYEKIFERKKSAPVLAGIFSSLLLLTRPIFLLFFIVLVFITIVVHFREVIKGAFLKRYARGMAIFLILNITAISSWCVRNKAKHDYFGMSVLMASQLKQYTRYFFHKYQKDEDEELNRFVDIYLEENCNPSRFFKRLEEEWHMTEVEYMQVYLKMHLKILEDYPFEYIKRIPDSASYYYKNYSAYWMTPDNNKLLNRRYLIPRIFKFFFRFYSTLYKNLASLLLMIVVLPAMTLILLRKRKKVFHMVFLIEGAINYNFLVSVLSTIHKIDNLRYRVPVEPLILLVFFSSFFLLGKEGLNLIKKRGKGFRRAK